MCGIAGFFNTGWNRADLERMTDRIAHRGPDAKGYYFNEADRIGLGHRRLSILDLSEAGNQPFYSRDGRYIMIFNGEVYNFREVAAKYGIVPRTHSDTEVILEAYAMKGPECISDFNGMFALAIWDTQSKELFILRDRFGVKPLLYFTDGFRFAFASELKSILSLDIPQKIHEQSLQNYFFLEYIPGDASIIKQVYKLPQGHYLKISQEGSVVLQKYYSLYDKLDDSLASITEEKALNRFEELLSSSVELRQISDVPIGAFLSGGTDSSLICALFQQQNKNPINTFTIGFDVKEFDETVYANRVADHLHTAHQQFHLTDKDSISIVDRLVDYYDEPFAAPSCIPSYLVCNKARSQVTVALSGDGGDELFMGYGYYGLYERLKKFYHRYPSLIRKGIGAGMRLLNQRYQRAARLLDFNDPDDFFIQLWSQEQYMFSEKEIEALTGKSYQPDVLTEDWKRIEQMPFTDEKKISLFDIQHYLANNLLFKMDSASMANSLEVRTPYLDYRLVEFSVNLPQHLKINNGTQKYLMKKLLERYLPKDLVYRTKWGFPAPVGDWLYGDLHYLIERWLSKEQLIKTGMLDPKTVEKLLDEFKSGKKFHYKRIWSMIIFQMWYAKYMQGNDH